MSTVPNDLMGREQKHRFRVAAESSCAERLSVRRRGPQGSGQGVQRDALFNDSVQKALAVLEAFGRGRRVLRLAEIASVAVISKPSAQRSIHTLEVLGYLKREERDTGWTLTPRSLSLAHSYLSGYGLIEKATRHLVALNQATGESVSLSEPDELDMVFVARFPGHQLFLIHMPLGRRLPMYCTASGRAYLSALPPADARRILRRSELRALTPMTVTEPKRIMTLLEAARADGYACSDQECYRGDITVAAPVLAEDGHPIGAVNISAATSRRTLEEMRTKLSALVIQTARGVTSEISPSG